MAFPTTISSLINTDFNVCGPYLSSNGAVYIITVSAINNQLHVFKATDPSSGWGAAGVDFTVPSGHMIKAIAGFQDGDNIHVVSRDADAANANQLMYHVFNIAADGWTVMNEQIKGDYAIASNLFVYSPVSIAVRSNGDVIVMYEGPLATPDIDRSRVYYARRESSVWTTDIALDNAGNNHYCPGQAIRGSSDNIHFFFQDTTNADAYQRTLNSSNVLESTSAGYDTSILAGTPDALKQIGCAYSASAGGTVVRFPYYNSFNPDIGEAKFSSSATPAVATVVNITGSVTVTSEIPHVISEAADGAVVYSVFVDTAKDLYVSTNPDDAGWTDPASIYTGSASRVFTNIYTRNTARVIGIAFVENEFKYTEYTISSVAVSSSPTTLFGLSMMGMGR